MVGTTLTILALAAAGAALYLWWRAEHELKRLSARQDDFLEGANGKSLESSILASQEQIRKLQADLKKLSAANRVVAELEQTCLQHVGMVRFNSFADAGGNNSFALAVLDGLGNGFVISSLYGRQSSRVYLKPIEAGASAIPLTEEEKKAILESRYAEAPEE